MAFDDLADLTITEADLDYEPYNRTVDVAGFDCGDGDLNTFLHDPSEVANYQEAGFGLTTLVYLRGRLVGFFTLRNDALGLKYVEARKKPKQFTKRQKEIVRSFPSILVGRFAVDNRLQKKGIGRFMVRYIVGLAMSQREQGVACRLILLQATPSGQPFYERLKFEYALEKDMTRGKRNKTMYLDLDAIQDAANE